MKLENGRIFLTDSQAQGFGNDKNLMTETIGKASNDCGCSSMAEAMSKAKAKAEEKNQSNKPTTADGRPVLETGDDGRLKFTARDLFMQNMNHR